MDSVSILVSDIILTLNIEWNTVVALVCRLSETKMVILHALLGDPLFLYFFVRFFSNCLDVYSMFW